jgi:hypothetical protein
MIRLRSYRGQPLVALTMLLGGWVALRAMAWEGGTSPAEAQPCVPVPLAGEFSYDQPGALIGGVGMVPDTTELARRVPTAMFAGFPQGAGLLHSPAPHLLAAFARQRRQRERAGPDISWRLTAGRPLVRSAISTATPDAASAPFYPVGSEPAHRDKRWSGDAWFLARRGGSAFLGTGLAPATYGASQAGGVLRYRLAPRSSHRPAAYLRTTAALNGSDEQEAALGLSARPLAGVPIVAAAELRATRQQSGMRLRPAAMLITELAPIELPLGTRAEAYGQAGYVGGRFATAFADGQLRVDRGVVRLGKGELRAGAGVWGGAQKGAHRLDIGPTAAMALGIGKGGSGRLTVDWRFRVKGNAAPDSGPAMTLSAGF